MRIGLILLLALALWILVFVAGCLFDWFDKPEVSLRLIVRSNFEAMTVGVYRRNLYKWREWRCKRAKQYLLKHDTDYQHQEASLELVRRRHNFYAAGGSPMDPKCPTFFDIMEERGLRPFGSNWGERG
jgi:hypothetical protein